MKRFMILAALLASIHAAGAEDAPSRSRIQDITKGARDLVPSMSSISMPALPSVSFRHCLTFPYRISQAWVTR